MNVALYARVSTADQDCAIQLAELRQYCASRCWTAAEFVDHGWSGRRADRPALLRLMKESYRYSAVLVWKLDRFGRSLKDLVENVQTLESHGIRFIAVSQGLDTDKSSPTSRLLLHLLAAIAEFEAETIRERVKAGVQHAKRVGTRSGKPIGRPKRVFRHDEAVERFRAGEPVIKIARDLGIGEGTLRRALAKTPVADAVPGVGPTDVILGP
jgi:putative DNA-invertase from lambdoid prophage Rac